MNKRLSIVPMLLAAVAAARAEASASPARLDEVAARGAEVMPFDLEKTLHVFDKTDSGGLQQVLAKDGGDLTQIRPIREHLSQIAARFARGDFAGPARIHGEAMPGLAELRAGAQQVRFEYRELPNGAQIAYASEQPALVEAIHRFFDAQLSDHARHAVGGHRGHHP